MTTEKQVAANRQNAQLSTGPTTPEGKDAVAQNALKHGLFAEENVIFGEDQAAYDQHRQALLASLNPVGPLETLLAERVVAIAWRLLRTGRMQSEVFDYINPYRYERKRKYYSFTLAYTIIHDIKHESIIDRVLSYEHRIEKSLYKACLELERLQLRRTRQTPPSPCK